MPEVLRSEPNALFVVIGGPPPLTGAEVQAQWLGAEYAPFAMRIQFTGWQSPANVAKWYETADILVVPSRYEPFGMVILEGMFYGLAVLAADVGGPSEILEHGRTGLLFPACDVQALSSALLWLVAHPLERQNIGRAAAYRIREQWLWKQKIPTMLNVYQELVSLRGLAACPCSKMN